MMTMGLMPSEGANGTSATAMTIVATLNIAGDSAGMKKCPNAFSMPMNTAATATSVRNGAMTRARYTVNSSLPGTRAKSPA